MNEQMERLIKERNFHEQKVRQISNEIRAFREACPHERVETFSEETLYTSPGAFSYWENFSKRVQTLCKDCGLLLREYRSR